MKRATRIRKPEDRNVRKRQERALNNDTLISLVTMAQHDSELRTQLFCIVRLDSFNRSSLLNTYLNELQRKGAQVEFRNAVRLLVDDGVANGVKKALAE